MRNGLQNMDMENESSDGMKSLLEQALMSPVYLKNEEVGNLFKWWQYVVKIGVSISAFCNI